jgi:hypothetical protein
MFRKLFNKEEPKMSEQPAYPPTERVSPVDRRSVAMDEDPRSVLYKKICEVCLKLFEEKNEQYGDSIVYTGVLGATVELIGCVGRLKKLVIQSPDAGKKDLEVLVDVLKDTLNYANIALQMIQEDNWRGR